MSTKHRNGRRSQTEISKKPDINLIKRLEHVPKTRILRLKYTPVLKKAVSVS